MTTRWTDLKTKKLSVEQLERLQEKVDSAIMTINLKAPQQLNNKTPEKPY